MDLEHALAFSRYATRMLDSLPELREELVATLDRPFDWPSARGVMARPENAETSVLATTLRTLRRRVFLHTLARDLTGRALLPEVCEAMTTLADLALGAAVSRHSCELAATHGEPLGSECGDPQQLIVVGMGKLGGAELNVSSDIDLVFVYPEEGETAGPRTLSNREFFHRLGQRVIRALHESTADGYVFRVDMRLRPYGEAGTLTTSFAGLEQYLVTQGRTWERYAWLKARPLTGIRHIELDALITPFVYRRYLDYDAYEGLRDVHRQIREQRTRRDVAANIKLGEGGIRELEFVVQALQIVRGGREPRLRERGTLPALAALAIRSSMPPGATDALRTAYLLLRNLEHRLQYRDDAQTHQVPDDANERAAVAAAMRYPSLSDFDRALAQQRAVVALHFVQVLGGPQAAESRADDSLRTLWEDPTPSPAAMETLANAGYADAAGMLAILSRVRTSNRLVALPELSRQRFDALLPQLLAVAAAHPGRAGAQPVFVRLLALLETVSRRSAYLALVIEHPQLLPRLAQLMGASAWAAEYLTRHPILLDELLDARILLAEPDWAEWKQELAQTLAEQAGDAERQMDALRHFHHTQTFRLLAQDLSGRLTVERLADHLSALTDLVLAATLDLCWSQIAKHGARPPRFAIIGYGKLGGKELGYASDLDLVFLYDVAKHDRYATTRPQRYTRLAQRVNTWLTTTTAAGRLFETDLRLRPDGESGLLVSSFSAFRKYQREHAWPWEHQALTRARFVAGDARLGAAFESEREAILCLPRDPHALAEAVVAMRRKMFAGHPNPTALFDVKHDARGMVDIEFAVQYLVLAHAHRHPRLTRNLGNIALLDIAQQLGLLAPDIAHSAADAYREFRRLQHEVRLTGAAQARVPPEPQMARRAAVAALWEQAFGADWAKPD
ncbi:MAG: bifunctional [glutamate--ammonia ligase]-adenylyl-L-tyrosine phosphorylase/[glutamate--ammonia-ligase] adenylyltransferase [Betaproteobacteria bacterium]|nr:bifunctional [glutamate--ammonia ligase]-adenylyl-L-tyrosine phosphorylase/[glutamate--ammonia-ligase] adenylyltransferase [Betaproteobacteria bacterium]